MKKKWITVLFVFVMILSLVSCGTKDSVKTESASPKDYVYVPEYIPLESEGDNTWFFDYRMEGDSLYYMRQDYDGENGSVTNTRCGYSFADGSTTSEHNPAWDNEDIILRFLDKDGILYALAEDYSAGRTADEGIPDSDKLFLKYNSVGELLISKDITELVEREREAAYISGLLKDSKGTIYLFVEDDIILLNDQGEELGCVDVPAGWVMGTGMDKDENVYFTYYEKSGFGEETVLAKIDGRTKKISEKYKDVPNTYRNFTMSEDRFLFYNDSKVYLYDLERQTSEELLSWIDYNINGNYVDYLTMDSRGDLVGVIHDWDTDETELVRLVRKDASQVMEKEELVLATFREDPQTRAMVVAFNKASDKYKITIKNYLDMNHWSETSYQDAVTALHIDILSEKNCPDILDLTYTYKAQLAAKGILEDLTPYLEKSNQFSKDDFLEHILECYTYNDKLVAIPANVEMYTIVGKSSVVGKNMGWTIDDFFALMEEYPDAELLEGMAQSDALQCGMMFNQDTFVDWSTGACHFDSDIFKDLLTYVAKFPVENGTYGGELRVEDRRNNKLLLDIVSIYELENIQLYPAMYDEEVTFVGFPTSDGSASCLIDADSLYGIISKSEHKDAAWEFIELFLHTASDSMLTWGLPTLREVFDKKFAESGKIESNRWASYEDWEYIYHSVTEEEVTKIKELIAVAAPVDGVNTNELTKIVLEEAQGFFRGDKTLDEVVKIIQNRAQIYVSENK